MHQNLFTDRLSAKVTSKKSVIMLSFDPNPDLFPAGVEKSAKGALEFGKKMIDISEDLILGVKFQLAYFEAFGSAGIAALEELNAYAKARGLITLMDGKRNDIGPTAEAYARAYLGGGKLGADALTVTPFLGEDGVLPFVEKCQENGRGIFVLVRTSNPSAKEIQGVGDLSVRIGELVEDWSVSTQSVKNEFTSVGAVIGATLDPDMIKFFRQEMPHAWFLMPGVGPQGGSMKSCLAVTNKEGLGVILPIGRAILYADDSKNWAGASRRVLQELWEEQFAELFAGQE